MPGPLLLLFYKELHEPRYSGFQQMENPLKPCFVIGGYFQETGEAQELSNGKKENTVPGRTQVQTRKLFRKSLSSLSLFLGF